LEFPLVGWGSTLVFLVLASSRNDYNATGSVKSQRWLTSETSGVEP